MTEQTDTHGWTIPTTGGDADVWGSVLNDFFDGELENNVILKDTYSNRPSASNTNLVLFLATDRRIVYWNNSGTWEAVFGLGTETDPVPEISYHRGVNFGSELSDSEGTSVASLADLFGRLETYTSSSDLPDPSTIDEPKIAYLIEENDYVGVYQ